MSEKKVDKKALSKTISEILGIEIDFSRLKTEDLQKLHGWVTNPVNLLGIWARSAKNMTGEMLEKSPLRELADLRVRDLVLGAAGVRGRGGLLGFGILNRLLGEKRK